ncbi:MAG: 6-phosphofructokinase [Anaerolineaceae bacterium]|nr:6-phosphofructokinase [Anaerolineaceae bacterium]
MKKIGVLTSGGDAPGMNAAIRAVVRTGIAKGWTVYGVKNGYAGLISGNIIPLGARDVGGIMQRGGTMLGSARSEEFKTIEGQRKAIRQLNSHGIEALVVIGGNGSQTGSFKLTQLGFPVVGVASTIDNDLYGSDITIGVDTALNVALEAVDRLKVTASSHQRAFLLEVMGRDCGYLALMTALAGGAEAVILPEVDIDPDDVADRISEAYNKGKAHAIVIVAEGAKYNAERLSAYFKEHEERLGFALRVAILGHIQRGGTPSAYDRILASRLGAGAVEMIDKGNTGVLVGWVNSKLDATPLEVVVSNKKQIDRDLVQLAEILD